MDLSDRFAETFACGCSWHAGQYFPCAVHGTPHSQHETPAPGCDLCADLLDEAREPLDSREAERESFE